MSVTEAEIAEIQEVEGRLIALYAELQQKYPKLKEIVLLGGYSSGVFCISTKEDRDETADFVSRMAFAMKRVKPRHRSMAGVNQETGKVELRQNIADEPLDFLVINPSTEPN
jgi:hypothetical protein